MLKSALLIARVIFTSLMEVHGHLYISKYMIMYYEMISGHFAHVFVAYIDKSLLDEAMSFLCEKISIHQIMKFCWYKWTTAAVNE